MSSETKELLYSTGWVQERCRKGDADLHDAENSISDLREALAASEAQRERLCDEIIDLRFQGDEMQGRIAAAETRAAALAEDAKLGADVRWLVDNAGCALALFRLADILGDDYFAVLDSPDRSTAADSRLNVAVSTLQAALAGATERTVDA